VTIKAMLELTLLFPESFGRNAARDSEGLAGAVAKLLPLYRYTCKPTMSGAFAAAAHAVVGDFVTEVTAGLGEGVCAVGWALAGSRGWGINTDWC
jgi:hypothetical protein